MKNVLITGGSGNLGRAAIDTFLTEGYNVIATVSPGKSLGGKGTTYEVDLTNEKSVETTMARIIADHGTIDVAILTVGGFAAGSLATTDGALLQKMISLNFNTAYFVARPVFAQMVKQNAGRIILIGSRPGLVPADGKKVLAYALSKSMIFRLAELLNEEAGEKNIVTSVIVPGTIDTPENRAAMPNADHTKWVQPEEITRSMLYLVSDNNKDLRQPVLKLYGNS